MVQNYDDRILLRISYVDMFELVSGIALSLISFVVPLVINVQSFDVLHRLMQALQTAEKTDLMLSAILLVMMNSIRCVPHYVGSFFIGESISFCWRGKSTWLTNSVLMILVLRLTYLLIQLAHGIHYDFGLPAVLIFLFEVLLRNLNYSYVSRSKKALLLILSLTAIQFLDIMPAMDGFPVGRGEISRDIKMSAEILGGEALLNITGLVGMLVFLMFSSIILFQLRVENDLRKLSVLQAQNHAIRVQMQLDEIKNRTHQEMQYLVHDLKSPLTAAQTLVGILKMESEVDGREIDVDYLTRIEISIDQMSRMISEILYEDRRSPITTEDLLKIVLSQISVTQYASHVHTDNQAPMAKINVNRILFSRALVNLLQNAAQATEKISCPQIFLSVQERENGIRFVVSDNGTGISQEQQSRVWDFGVSGATSSGLGLAFVRSVVEKVDGEISMESTVNIGTSITIAVPKEEVP